MTIHRWAQLTAGMTLLLLIAGGLVTSTGSGLAVPDWPLSYGMWFPPMVGGIFYEHGHRMIAAVVGLMIAILAVWLWRAEPRRWVRRLGYAAFAAVVTQAVLGGATVLLLLPPPISVAHACLGPLVFCLVVCIAVASSSGWRAAPATVAGARTRRLSLALLAMVFAQLLLGAIIRHTGRALLLHIVGAAGVVALVAGLCWRLTRPSSIKPAWRRLAMGIALAVVGQILLGVWIIVSNQSVAVATAHVALGAVILASACAMNLILWRAHRFTPHRVMTYLELTKPRLTSLALFATAVGAFMGSPRPMDLSRLLVVLVGSALVGGGANALNQWAEWDRDALMRRTRMRPVPSGRLRPSAALRFGLVVSVAGLVVLTAGANVVAGLLGLLTVMSYIGWYTPLKRRSCLCTLVGAIPGALPPLIGWAGMSNRLSLDAIVLFAMLFVWQLPHFLAIAWLHRDDYARAAFRMLPVLDPDGASTARQMVVYGAALLPISLLPTILGTAGEWYFVGALGLGLWFLVMIIGMARRRTAIAASRSFMASVGYLTLVLLLMVIDRTPV